MSAAVISRPRLALLREATGGSSKAPPLRGVDLRSPRPPRRTRWTASAVLVGLALVSVVVQRVAPSDPVKPAAVDVRPSETTPGVASTVWSDLPLDFVANDGQWRDDIGFVASRGALEASFDRRGVGLSLGSVSTRLDFEGAAADADIVGEQQRAGTYNYIVGNDPTVWREHVPAYSSIRYDDLYAGIDVRFRQQGQNLEYDALLQPHADVDQLVVRPSGVQRLTIAPDGSLELLTVGGVLRHTAPIAWNVLPNGEQRPVESEFRLVGDDRFGFAISGHDPSLPLVIDPGIEWSTFVGGSGDETLGGMVGVNDGSGDVLIGGWTRSPEFPATGRIRAAGSAFVARVSGSGNSLVYATYFGGSNVHTVADIAVDAGGNPLVVGDTNSKDFPVTPGAFDSTPPGTPNSPLDFGDYDGYVLRLNSSGGGPLMATYLAGDPVTGTDNATRAGYDPAGNPIAAGITSSANFPTTTGAYDRTKGGTDIFVSRFNPTGTQLTYSTFLGGDGSDSVFDMVVGSDGAINLTGQTIVPTTGTRFPTTADGFDRTTLGGDWEAVFARLMPNGAGAADLRYSTYMGGNQYIEAGNGIAVDPADPTLVTVSGFTRSGDFPTTAGALLRVHPVPVDGSMGWVARFRTPAGGAGTLLWSTLYGASGNQTANDVVVDASGSAIIVGGTAVNNPPTTQRAFDRIPANGVGTGDRADGYIAKLSSDGSQLLYSTLLGASAGEAATELVAAGNNSFVVAGVTNSTDFPTTAGAFDTVYASDGKPSGNDAPGTLAEDIYITRINLDTPAGDTTPPPAPTISWPAEGTVFNFNSSTGVRVAYDWSDVTDASGIRAYHVQVSPNAEFRNDLQAEFDDWYEPWSPTSFDSYFYCCSDSTNLTYSMRVQAMDNAGNLGPWSAVRTYRLVSGPTSTGSGLRSLLISPELAFGNQSITGTVTLHAAAPAGGAVVSLISQYPSRVVVPPSVTVPAGQTSATFAGSVVDGPTVTTTVMGSYGGSSQAWYVQTGRAEPTLVLGTLTLSSATVQGGGQVTGTVTFNGIGFVPGPGGAVVHLGSTNPAVASVPPSVTVPQGASSATFPITTTGVSSNTQVSIVATRSSMQTKVLEVLPAGGLSALSFNPTTAVGSGGSTGTVTLGGPAPAGGTSVALTSSDTRWVVVPASVTVPAGATSVTFTAATTSDPTQGRFASVSARAGGIERFATLNVNPPPPGPSLSSMSLNPASVTGGASSTGTVTLNGAAPAGGVVVSLSSGNTAAATVPASVTIAAGSTSATFAVSTSAVATTTSVTISGSAAGVTRSASLSVGATGGGGGTTLPAPQLSSPSNNARFNRGRTITFDWSDVAGAASYVLEIDDSQSFSNPLVRSVTTTASTTTVSGLPSRRMWWRVRAVAADGTPGTTSSSRRFEIR